MVGEMVANRRPFICRATVGIILEMLTLLKAYLERHTPGRTFVGIDSLRRLAVCPLPFTCLETCLLHAY